MPLIIETGAIVANANSYASAADADAYVTARNLPGWAGTTSEKEALLLQAAELLDASYYWAGEIVSEAQAMRWPRKGVTDRDGREIAATALPTSIQRAQIELALLLKAGLGVGGSFGSTATAGGPIKKVKAGSVEVEYASASRPFSPLPMSNIFPDGQGEKIDRILAGLFAAPRQSIKLGLA
jgi:hypothetical protein